MKSRNRFKNEELGGNYCDFEEGSVVDDAFELFDPSGYPDIDAALIHEFNRRAALGNQRYRIACYREEMFAMGFNAGMYICRFDAEENMTSFEFTDETRRMLGYEGLEDLPNEFDSWVKTLLPNERDVMVPIFWSTVRNHRDLPDISHAEYRMMRKDGSVIWVTGAGRFIRRDDGTLEMYMGCYRDVTAEHEKDDYLRIAAGIGKIFNFSLYIDMADASYQIVSTNEYVEKEKCDPDAFQFLRDNVDLSVHEDCKAELKAWIQPDVITRALAEDEVVTKDFYSADAEKWFRATFIVGNKNEDGSLDHIVYGCQDVSREKQIELQQKSELEKHLTEISQLYELIEDSNTIMSSAGIGMWHIILKDGAEPRMQANEKMAELLGIAGRDLTEEETYSSWYDNIVPSAIPSVQASVGEMLDGKVSENTYQWRHPEKGVIYVRCGGSAITLDDGSHLLSGYHSDVTDIVEERENREAEIKIARDRAEAANRAKTAFLFNMSHDIRTPMNAIMGYTDLIEKNYDNKEKCIDYLHKTQYANKFLLALINDVLEMARIESGKVQLVEDIAILSEMRSGINAIFAGQMKAKKIKFTVDSDVHTKYVICDEQKLREIYLNILSNAVKYTPEGGSITVTIRELPSERPGYMLLHTEFADTGIGMSEEFLPHIFEEFSRAQSATETHLQGTGLGMPIVKNLIELMGGTISVESELGRGSTFTVELYLKISDEAPVNEPQGWEGVSGVDFDGSRILLAEDNDLNAEIAIEILQEFGLQIERAIDGVECIEKLNNALPGYYDLILMDVQMPRLNGYEATKKIRALDDSAKASIPILAMTANAFDEDKNDALNAGMNGHIAKPIEIPKLATELQAMLHDKVDDNC